MFVSISYKLNVHNVSRYRCACAREKILTIQCNISRQAAAQSNGRAIRKVCAQFVALCGELGLLRNASVAIDGSKFKAVNTRDKNFTRAKMERRLAQIEESVARYLSQLDTADLQEPSEALATRTAHLKEKKLAKLASELQRLKTIEKEMLASPDQQISLTDPDSTFDGNKWARLGRARPSCCKAQAASRFSGRNWPTQLACRSLSHHRAMRSLRVRRISAPTSASITRARRTGRRPRWDSPGVAARSGGRGRRCRHTDTLVRCHPGGRQD